MKNNGNMLCMYKSHLSVFSDRLTRLSCCSIMMNIWVIACGKLGNICKHSALIYYILVNPAIQLQLSRNHSIGHFCSGMFLYSSSCSCISLAASLLSKKRRRCPSPLGFCWVPVAFITGQFLSVWEPHALHYSPQLLLRSEDVSCVVLRCHTVTVFTLVCHLTQAFPFVIC